MLEALPKLHTNLCATVKTAPLLTCTRFVSGKSLAAATYLSVQDLVDYELEVLQAN